MIEKLIGVPRNGPPFRLIGGEALVKEMIGVPKSGQPYRVVNS
ncbi:MAG: hypothetical protein Q4B54_05465 [Coriobacteriales bacterium]|nr:hypothetical protein [Coriobacteriales bacterium]